MGGAGGGGGGGGGGRRPRAGRRLAAPCGASRRTPRCCPERRGSHMLCSSSAHRPPLARLLLGTVGSQTPQRNEAAPDARSGGGGGSGSGAIAARIGRACIGLACLPLPLLPALLFLRSLMCHHENRVIVSVPPILCHILSSLALEASSGAKAYRNVCPLHANQSVRAHDTHSAPASLIPSCPLPAKLLRVRNACPCACAFSSLVPPPCLAPAPARLPARAMSQSWRCAAPCSLLPPPVRTAFLFYLACRTLFNP